MPVFLIIDTSTEHASICLADGLQVIGERLNSTQKEHAAWLHLAINDLLTEAGKVPANLSAIALTAGPGSYTGLRVGMSAAKGLCYALGIPLIPLNTLEAMASAVVEEDATFLCPLIDARRMEVFTAVYDRALQPVMAPEAMIVDDQSFAEWLAKGKTIFFGSGKNKLEPLIHHPNAVFKYLILKASDFVKLTNNKFITSVFSDLAYVEPIYLKEHYTLFSSKS